MPKHTVFLRRTEVLDIRATLDAAAMNYDAKLYAKDGNIYRIGIIFRALSLVEKDIQGGSSLARALYDNFNDRLLSVMEKACKLPLTYGGGAKSKGRPD
jgi:hypothetical protein